MKRFLVVFIAMVMLVALAALPALALTRVFVTDVSPDGGSADVAASSNVRATFNIRLDKSTVNSKTFYLKRQGSSTVVPAQVSYRGTTKTATLNPNRDLAHGATYTAYIKGGRTGVRGSGGQTLGGTRDATATYSNAKVSWIFTVERPVDVTPTTLDLSPTDVLFCAPTQGFLTVTNNGPGSVTFADVSITGPDAAYFSDGAKSFIQNNGAFTVLEGNSFQDQVTFSPGSSPTDRQRDYEALLTYKDGTGATIGNSAKLTASVRCLNFG